MEKNDVFVAEIIDMTSEGTGLAKIDGFPLFVKDAYVGDVCEVGITKVLSSYAYARLVRIVTPSPYRCESACEISRKCGGCQFMELEYSRELEYKADKVRNNIERIGKVYEFDFCDIIGMDDPSHYRNKSQYPVGLDNKGHIVTGFYAGRTHDIIPNKNCAIGSDVDAKILEAVVDYMIAGKLHPYDEKKHTGLVRHVLIREGKQTGQIMVCVVINSDNLPNSKDLIERLTKIKGVCSISINVNKKDTNVILGDETYSVYGEMFIEDYIGDVKFRISPQSFFQVNPLQTLKLYQKVLEFAGISPEDVVFDLYCGVGTISLFLAKSAKKVYGVEIVPQAIQDAWKNAAINNINNVDFRVGKAEEIVPKMYEEGINADVVVVDPPRKGCDDVLLNTIVSMNPKRLVYVSCDSATLARDINFLTQYGFHLQKVQPVDMFPRTVHVETVCLLSNRKPDTKVRIDVDLEDYYRIKDSKKNQD